MGPAGHLGHHSAEPDVLLDTGGDFVREQLVAADDADAGLVAGGLDAQDQRSAHDLVPVTIRLRGRSGPCDNSSPMTIRPRDNSTQGRFDLSTIGPIRT